MGSYAPEADNSREEIHVLVTGFGPFLEFENNPAYLIAHSLPETIDVPILPRINIHAYDEPIRVEYKYVRSTIPGLVFSNLSSKDASQGPEHVKPKPRYDIVLHIGMAFQRAYYSLETLAHRDGYTKKDVNGDSMSDDTLWKDEYRSPEVFHTSFNTEDVWRRWKAGLTDEDLRPSDDPGRYLCDFIYYTSLAEYWRHGSDQKRPVMFLHVPAGYEKDDLERGRKVTLGLIEALVWSLRKEGG